MLTIDIGNSRIKWALFNDSSIDFKALKYGAFRYNAENFEDALTHANLPVTSSTLEISFVTDHKLKPRLISWLKKHNSGKFNFANTQAKQCHITNAYQQPDKLGVDRWLAMIAGYNLHPIMPHETLCIIDCGTAITLDMLDSKGCHLGGLIIPGYQTMVQSLINNTGNIASFERDKDLTPTTGELAISTEASIVKGCTQCITGGLFDIISHHKKNGASRIKCIITGGDGKWISDTLNTLSPDNVQTSYNPYLVLQGLVLASLNTYT